jgi:hypothetical protein
MFSSKLKSPKKNNIIIGLVVLLVIGLILWLTFGNNTNSSSSCPRSRQQSKIIVPIGNGQSVALSKEEYAKLNEEVMKEKYRRENYRREGFYVSSQDYIPPVQTEAEYNPMLSLYKPKETTRVIPEPTPAPAPTPAPMPVPTPMPIIFPTATGTNGMTGTSEPYGNVFIDNIILPLENEDDIKHRMNLAKSSPFFLNNGMVTNGQVTNGQLI